MSSLYLQSTDNSVSTSVLCRDQNLFGAYSCETFPMPEMATNQFRRLNFGSDRSTTVAMPNWRFAMTTDFNGATRPTSSSRHTPKTAIAMSLLSRLIESKDCDITKQKAINVSPARAQKSVKKVCFSDEMGLALTSVRTFSSSFSCPFPNSEERLSSCSSVEQSSTRIPSFLLNFRQPRSCMFSFVERLEKNSVQLGSIEIKDGVIVGEIVVKNLAYEKTVFVRYTGSNWNSFTDIHASYVPRPEPNFPGCDTFEFRFPVPLEVNRDGFVEFAVCYEVGGKTFWDNGGDGKNYRVTKLFPDCCTARSSSITDRTVSDILQKTAVNWSEFTGRKNGINFTLPYW